ncbi:unnamed protein product [Knipowitschia caucasica]
MVVLREYMCPGLEPELIRDLRAADVSTVEQLVSCDLEALAQTCCISYKALFAIRRVLLAQHTAFPVSGADLYEELLLSTAIISTGHPRLDQLLDSGLYTGELTELAGGAGSGKTQVCLGVAVHTALHLKQSVIFIDTTGGITGSRLLQMIQCGGRGAEEETAALQRIHVFRVFDVFSLLDCLYNLRHCGLQQVSGGGASVRVVIMDSVCSVLSPLLGSRVKEGLSLMVQVGCLLKVLAKDFNVAVLVTNHVTRSVGGRVRPALGVSWSHLPRTRLLLETRGDTHLLQETRGDTHLLQEETRDTHLLLEETRDTHLLQEETRGDTHLLPEETRGDTHLLPEETRGDIHLLPEETRGDTHLLQETRGDTHLLPEETRGDTHLLPEETRGDTHLLPEETRGDTHLLQEETRGHSLSSWRSATLTKSSRQPCHRRVDFDLRWWSHRDTSTKRKDTS